MGRLTTHVLDTAHGSPAKGLRITLEHIADDGPVTICSVVTNDDGRCDGPLLDETAFQTGRYRLTFSAGAYFDALGLDLPNPKFLDNVVIEFGIADAGAHYHVPLLISPFGYSTYRGS